MKKTSILTVLKLGTIALVLGTLGVQGQILQVNSQAAFNVTSPSTIDFESMSGTTAYIPSFTLQSVNFAGFDAISGGAFGPGDGSEFVLNNTSPVTITLQNTGLNAAGFNIFSPGASAPLAFSGTVTDNFDNTFDYTATAPAGTGSPSLGFLGFVDTYSGAYITSITISSASGTFVGVDNFISGIAAPATPEPNTWALMVLGGALMLSLARRRRLI